LIGTLPMAIHPDPQRALVIGAGEVAAFSDRTRVDVVELSSAVANAARQFSLINQNLLTRPNVRLKVDDGRNHMLLTTERYDVITADVILPMHAGAGNLYSVEYYRLMRRVLTRHGSRFSGSGAAARPSTR
jgi:spermidine synthase